MLLLSPSLFTIYVEPLAAAANCPHYALHHTVMQTARTLSTVPLLKVVRMGGGRLALCRN